VTEKVKPEKIAVSGVSSTQILFRVKIIQQVEIFSNRVYPTRLNTKLYQLDVRSNIHQIIYDEFIK